MRSDRSNTLCNSGFNVPSVCTKAVVIVQVLPYKEGEVQSGIYLERPEGVQAGGWKLKSSERG